MHGPSNEIGLIRIVNEAVGLRIDQHWHIDDSSLLLWGIGHQDPLRTGGRRRSCYLYDFVSVVDLMEAFPAERTGVLTLYIEGKYLRPFLDAPYTKFMTAAVKGCLNELVGTLVVLSMQMVHSEPFTWPPSTVLFINNNYYIYITFY